jgi:hypothetical protein
VIDTHGNIRAKLSGRRTIMFAFFKKILGSKLVLAILPILAEKKKLEEEVKELRKKLREEEDEKKCAAVRKFWEEYDARVFPNGRPPHREMTHGY